MARRPEVLKESAQDPIVLRDSEKKPKRLLRDVYPRTPCYRRIEIVPSTGLILIPLPDVEMANTFSNFTAYLPGCA